MVRRSVRGHFPCSARLALTVVAGLTLLAGVGLATPPDGGLAPAGGQTTEPRVVEVVATRYAFEPAEIQVTQGERVRLLVKSGDGLHGFEIKRFRISKEIPRGGDPVVVDFTPEEAGRFPILCSVYCGDGHDDMTGALVVTARASAQP